MDSEEGEHRRFMIDPAAVGDPIRPPDMLDQSLRHGAELLAGPCAPIAAHDELLHRRANFILEARAPCAYIISWVESELAPLRCVTGDGAASTVH